MMLGTGVLELGEAQVLADPRRIERGHRLAQHRRLLIEQVEGAADRAAHAVDQAWLAQLANDLEGCIVESKLAPAARSAQPMLLRLDFDEVECIGCFGDRPPEPGHVDQAYAHFGQVAPAGAMRAVCHRQDRLRPPFASALHGARKASARAGRSARQDLPVELPPAQVEAGVAGLVAELAQHQFLQLAELLQVVQIVARGTDRGPVAGHPDGDFSAFRDCGGAHGGGPVWQMRTSCAPLTFK
jgi:hypothetical protein